MSTQTQKPQELLFSEPSIAETGIWCSLNDGIDPSEWASLCRYIGNLGAREFREVVKVVKSRENAPVEESYIAKETHL